MVGRLVLGGMCVLGIGMLGGPAAAQEILPFPPVPSASTAGVTMQDSTYAVREEPRRLPADAPNILIILIDDVGPGQSSAFGGSIHTPTMERIMGEGIGYNRFHTTAMCSPTRAALLTGRNHHRVAAGQIAEFANDWDGYAGVQPKTAAMVPEVLRHYGYATGAWGKWHNTPATQTTAAGPFDFWPTGYGFEYFYGFLAGEDSQWHPNLVRNTTQVARPETAGGNDYYHLTEDLADDAIRWLEQHRAFRGDQPFFMYWATGAAHGPHHVPTEWADKYKGKFDDGWDALRRRNFEGAVRAGWVPADTELTPRPDSLPGWESIPERERPFQRRLMEVQAGFIEHTDHHAGRVIDALDRLGYAENTIVFYIWGDNGASAEGQAGTVAELLAQNGVQTTIDQHLAAVEALGGLSSIGQARMENMYHAGWAWAASSPFRSTKLVAAHFGGSRNPMAVRWPAKVRADGHHRAQFSHVIDVVPTIYDILDITPPKIVNGFEQIPFDGTSFAASLTDADADEHRRTQYFEIMGSRAIYHDGWMASTFGPRTPWARGTVDISKWNPSDDVWELHHVAEDWSQSRDLSAEEPERLEAMKELFLVEAAKNQVMPIGGGLWALIYPQYLTKTPYTEWTFSGPIERMPEFTAPRIGTMPNVVTIKAEIPDDAEGVLYSVGGYTAGLSCYVHEGVLNFEYSFFLMDRTHLKADGPLPTGECTIVVETRPATSEFRFGGPLEITLKVNGSSVATGTVPQTPAVLFTANDSFDVGADNGTPVSDVYFHDGPARFNGTIRELSVRYLTK
ncbi:MAG: arylsulfatase [Phycisphaerales bacterium]